MLRSTTGLALLALVVAHGDHSFDLGDEDAGMTYAERHMHTEHHIDSFDLPSFFKLHDLNLDGFWDQAEIKAVYGLHHHSVKNNLPNELEDGRAWAVVEKVLSRLDTDKDGKISMEEFVAGGREGLPNFEGYKHLGHHYDEESEYFLHHEELYHSTPETQTDESYIHPEDIEHFSHHEHIEAEEEARERIFEGLDPNANLEKDHVIQDPLDQHAHAPGEGPPGEQAQQAQKVLEAGTEVDGPPPVHLHRETPGAMPNRIKPVGGSAGVDKAALKEAGEAAKGKNYDGHGRPRSAEERLRAGVPYKYKMRKGLRADEF